MTKKTSKKPESDKQKEAQKETKTGHSKEAIGC
jgi:hypothetical protein